MRSPIEALNEASEPSFGTPLSDVLTGAAFGFILASLLVILRGGVANAAAELLAGALTFGALGWVRWFRRSGAGLVVEGIDRLERLIEQGLDRSRAFDPPTATPRSPEKQSA
jgi:hypothetical protein